MYHGISDVALIMQSLNGSTIAAEVLKGFLKVVVEATELIKYIIQRSVQPAFSNTRTVDLIVLAHSTKRRGGKPLKASGSC